MSATVLAILGPNGAEAAELAWRFSPDAPVVGDVIDARLVFTGPRGAVVDWGDGQPEFTGADAEAEARVLDEPADGVRAARAYALHADLPGRVVLPRTTLAYTEPDGRQGRVSAPQATVPVAGVFDPDNPPPPAPAKGPLSVPMPWWPFVLGAALLAALTWVGYRLRRRGPLPIPLPPPAPAPERPPLAVALARLDALDPSLEPRLLFGALSAIARDYLAGRHRIPAPAMTGSEVGAAIRARGDSALAPLAEWLPRWDFFKFAPVAAPNGAAARAVLELRAWLGAQAASGAASGVAPAAPSPLAEARP
ncbi:MAG: hypothetical protein HZA24_05780 [Nitrospirae bacterium]|nr:hypothetical protein [Nitrospirota bacterium]